MSTEVTPGEINEAHLLSTLLTRHRDNTQTMAETVVADTKYGTADNYLTCCDLGVSAHIPDLRKSHNDYQGIFSAVAQALACSDSGISHIRHTEHYDTAVLWQRAVHGEGIRVTINKETVFQSIFIVFEYP